MNDQQQIKAITEVYLEFEREMDALESRAKNFVDKADKDIDKWRLEEAVAKIKNLDF